MSRDRERGSALLIVFLFAAIVAIMLYTEMPVAVFEARRQKEQLLVGRGEEYAHAVKLYVRKFGRYPASIDQLETTNRIRFLRHRFKDPFTGKDDWRLLHADPNGALVDSKVKNKNPLGVQGTKGGANSGSGSNSGFGSTSSFGSNSSSGSNSSFGSNSGFGSSASSSNSSFGSSGSFASSSNTPPEVVVPPVRRRGAVVPSNGVPTEQTETSSADTEQQDPAVPLMPSGQAEQLQQADELPGNTAGQTQGANATGQTGPASQSAGSTQPNSTQSGQPGVTAVANAPSGGAAAQPQRFASATGPAMGMISSGGIAGVASKAGGKTIKVVNEQTNYLLWEFYYDPRKDLAGGMTAMAPGGQPQTGAPAMGPQNPNSGAFGSTTGAAPAPQNPAAAPQNGQEGAGAGSQPQEPQQQEPQQQEPQEPQDPQ